MSRMASALLIEYCFENCVIDRNFESSPLYCELSWACASSIEREVSKAFFFGWHTDICLELDDSTKYWKFAEWWISN